MNRKAKWTCPSTLVGEVATIFYKKFHLLAWFVVLSLQ